MWGFVPAAIEFGADEHQVGGHSGVSVNKKEENRMRSKDYMTLFAEVGRLLCDGADSNWVMNLIAGKITETLDLKGCFIKMKNLKGDQVELLASCGLTEKFLFSKPDDTPDCVCSNLPGKTICIPRLQNGETTAKEIS